MPVWLSVCVLLPLPVLEADCDAVTLAVDVTLAVRVTLAVAVEDTELVCEPVFVTVRLPVALLVGVTVREPLEEAVEVPEEDGVCRRDECGGGRGEGGEGVRRKKDQSGEGRGAGRGHNTSGSTAAAAARCRRVRAPAAARSKAHPGAELALRSTLWLV